jgi:PadR family transcriptional regulator PadR
MKNTIKLTQLELVLLQLVFKGKGNWSWYEIASSLSRLDVPREPDMMTVLKDMKSKGLVERHIQPGSPRDRWELTPIGSEILMECQSYT